MSDFEKVISAMTIDEKIALLAGKDVWHTVPIPRLGIPSIKVTDGPNGVRGASRDLGPSAVCLPVGTALGATWNVELMERLGKLLAEEVRLKSAHILLAPTVNIHRTPIAGRNFECFAEDPYLSGTMATAYINGIQNHGAGACIKHFVCNDQEYQRHSISAEVDERPLREIYLEPFRLALRDAQPWSVMSAYNRVNGEFASEHDRLLKGILKEEWGFDGLVMSDWFGTYTPEVPAGGLDLEMPGPARWMAAEHVEIALERGDLTEAALDDKVRRLLLTAERTGAFENPTIAPEQGADRPDQRQLTREAAQETIVLLTNQGILPLKESKLKRIAVIGELARWPNVMGGGSSQINAHPIVSPLEGIRSRAGEKIEVHYSPGCFMRHTLPAIDPALLTTERGEPGLDIQIFDNLDFSGKAAFEKVTKLTGFGWFDKSVPNVNQERFCVRLSGHFNPLETGLHTIGLSGIGKSKLYLAGELILESKARDFAQGSRMIELPLEAGKSYTLQLDFRWEGAPRFRSFHLGHRPPQPADLLADAVATAKKADVVILLAGLTHEWESEGFDRRDMKLPSGQDDLIEKVAAVNPNTIVALNAGSAVEMPWVNKVSAVVEQWYNGQECGNALADILFGDVNPSGKLPTTFPKRLEDNPAYINYPGENGRVYYGEGLFVGYRYYDKKEIEPLFPFGHGLSYTQFKYSNLRLSKQRFSAAEGVTVSCEVRNVGAFAGKEIVQLYVADIDATVARPEKELKGFAKVDLAPGETKTVTFQLDQEAFWFFDTAQAGWRTEAGEFEILIGASSRDLRLRESVTLLQ
jgi:beta-glucosidase